MKIKDIVSEAPITIDYRPAQRAAMDTVNPADFPNEREYARAVAAAGNLAGVGAMGGRPAAAHPVEPPAQTTATPLSTPSQSGQAAPATAPRSAWAPGVLGMGSVGPEVEALQKKLGIEPDGKFGPITKKAVQDLQTKLGVTADGAYGPVTKKAHEASTAAHPTLANTTPQPGDVPESIDRILTIAGLR